MGNKIHSLKIFQNSAFFNLALNDQLIHLRQRRNSILLAQRKPFSIVKPELFSQKSHQAFPHQIFGWQR